MDERNDRVIIKPLGGGQEVGRSCIMVEFRGKKVLLDCGLHPGLPDEDARPTYEPSELKPDLLLVSHFHIDHCGAVPVVLTQDPELKCYMTHATKTISKLLLTDYLKVSKLSESRLYRLKDLDDSYKKILGIDFHETWTLNGIKFTAYHAGHVLGAAMFLIEIEGVKILYTGDYSMEEDRHLMRAKFRELKPDILITESTYGTKIHDKREEREERFTSVVRETVERGGRCLIPVFALGRAQELLLILDEYWSMHPELHHVPIYYASALAHKCIEVYKSFLNVMNDSVREKVKERNPFSFKHISNLKSLDHFEDIGPCVVLASPGMMQNGMSRDLLEAWCGDWKNTCIIAGYSVEGTLAREILGEPTTIVTLDGRTIPRNCQIESISFSAHVDYQQNLDFIRSLRPPNIVLVHGEAAEMAKLYEALGRECDWKPAIYAPANDEQIFVQVEPEVIIKVMGKLAAENPPKAGTKLSGVLARKNNQYYFVDPSDVKKYFNIHLEAVEFKLHIPFSGTLDEAARILSTFDAHVVEQNHARFIKMSHEICIYSHTEHSVTIVWDADRRRRMYVHAAIGLLLNPDGSQKDSPIPDEKELLDQIATILETENKQSEGDGTYTLFSSNSKVKFNIYRKEIIQCEDETIKRQLMYIFSTPAFEKFLAKFHPDIVKLTEEKMFK